MPHWQGKRKIAVVTAYVRPDGVPDFTLTEVEVTHEEHENGLHYDLVEAQLTERGFDEPLIHFDEFEAPTFLVPAVKEHLGPAHSRLQPDEVFPF